MVFQWSEDKNVNLILIEERGKKCYVSIKDCNTLRFMHNVGESIFVAIVYKLSEQQIHWNVIGKTALKLMVYKGLRWRKRWIC